MTGELLQLIFKSIRYRPRRSWLTILGVVIAVMLVVVIFSLGSGMRNAISKALAQFGSDLIMIFPGKESNPFVGILGGQRFAEDDIRKLETIPGVRFVVPMVMGSQNTEYRGEKQSALIHAGPWKTMRQLFEESRGIVLKEGAWPFGERSDEVVAGSLAAQSLYKRPLRVGDDILIKSKRFRIAGILSPIGIREDDNSIYISFATYHDITGLKRGAQSIAVKVDPDANLDLVTQTIKFNLSEQETVPDFTVLTPEQANRLVGNVLAIVELFLLVIALIALVVGSVGITNTMYTSVMERTRQIGIMKAIGARNDTILSLFLIESGGIGLAGGILGIALGIASAYIIGLVGSRAGVDGLFSWAALDYLGMVVILFITFLVGIISGVLPARQAARLEPAEALRYE